VTQIVPDVGWGLAFGAGLLSFLSPCVAPLVPGYLSFLASSAGVGAGSLPMGAPLRAPRGETERVLTVSLLFVLGFSAVFVVLGAGAALFGAALEAFRPQLNRVAGLLMILIGISLMGVVRVPFLYQERRPSLIDRPFGPLSTVIMGMAFAVGWTPCIGPILAAILFYAGAAETVERGALLLLAYSLGLGAPFVLIGLGWGRALGLLSWAKRHALALNVTSGALLIGLGMLFLTNRVFYLNLFAQRLYYELAR
jgi:cytochrome c-type biogenesis protein